MEVSKKSPAGSPRGSFSVRCDEKGRLKLPTGFQQYLKDRKEKVVFITTLDRVMARIYPSATWAENEAKLKAMKNTRAAADVSMIANHYGADSEIDGQGRVLVPTLLRRELGLENQTVWLQHFGDRFNLYSDSYYQERFSKASENLVDKVSQLEEEGLL